MVIYADVIFLHNSYIDFLLLWLTSGIRKQRTSIWRLVLAALVGGIYSTLYLWSSFASLYTIFCKLLISLILIWIAFGFAHPLAYLRNLGVFYLTCFVTGGAMIALHYFLTGDMVVGGGILFSQSQKGWGSPVSWLFVFIGFPLVWFYTRSAFRSIQERAEVYDFLTPIRIYINDRKIECVGLVDTGNQLRDPITRAPVWMVELDSLQRSLPTQVSTMVRNNSWEKEWNQLPLDWIVRLRVIPYRAAGQSGEMMIAFKADEVSIWKDERWNKVDPVIIGIDVRNLSSDGTYQAIIHPSCVSIAG